MKTVTTLLLNKIVAIFSGPGGITIFAHLQNLIAIVNHLPNDGINRGFIRLYHDVQEEDRNTFLGQILIVNTLILMIILLFIAVFPQFFWENFSAVISNNFIYIFFLSAAGIIWYYSILAYFQAARKFGTYSIIVGITSILILAGSTFIIYSGNFEDFISAYLVLQAASFFVALVIYFKSNRFSYNFPSLKIDVTKLKPLSEYLAMALSVLLFTFITDFFVRNYAIDEFGIRDTGYWQAVVRFSDYYKSFFITIVGAVFYAEVSAHIADKEFIKRYLKKILSFIIPIIGLALLSIYFLRDIILSVFYSNEFMLAGQFFAYQLAGDFFALLSFLFIYIIMAAKRTAVFISVQFLSTAIYILLLFFLVEGYGLQGFVMAHFFRYIFFFLLVVFLNKKILI